MNELSISDAGFSLGINVCVTKRNKKTGRIIEQVQKHNRCLQQQLFGIVKFLNGEYNHTAPQGEQDYYNWIPRYLAVGTNIPAGGEVGIGTEVSMTDTRLLNEISPRIALPERNKIIALPNQNYVQLVIETYLPDELYNNKIIAEAGLFANETGNNCMFRVVFPGIEKTIDTVVQVSWTISIISIASENNPTIIVNKADLETAFTKAMDTIKTKLPAATDLCNALWTAGSNSSGIYVYTDRSVSQETVNTTVGILNDLADELANT